MNLRDEAGGEIRLTFPDVSGEIYDRMWERRDCDRETVDMLTSGSGVLLFVHSDEIQAPEWIVNMAALAKKLDIPYNVGEPIPWHPKLSPTQVKLIGLLQLLRQPPLDIGPRKLAVMLSAWDKAAVEGLEPRVFLATRLPLLYQYLLNGTDNWNWQVYGISAQGGEYEREEASPHPLTEEQRSQLDALRSKDSASTRIQVLTDSKESHDLTEPIAWLKS
jgi:hypothetical protein